MRSKYERKKERKKKEREKPMEIQWIMETSVRVTCWSYKLQWIFNLSFFVHLLSFSFFFLFVKCLTNRLIDFWRLDISLKVNVRNELLKTVETAPTNLINLQPHLAN